MYRVLNWYFLFLIIPLIYLFFITKGYNFIKFSNINLIKKTVKKRGVKSKIGKWLIFISFVFFIVALSRPQSIKNFNI